MAQEVYMKTKQTGCTKSTEYTKVMEDLTKIAEEAEGEEWHDLMRAVNTLYKMRLRQALREFYKEG